jgi:integrase
MKLTKDSVAKLALPPGKSEHFEWDADLPGFGIRLRGDSKRWVVQYRFGSHQHRESLGDTRKITLDDARRIARNRFAQVELGTDPAAERAKAKAATAAARLTLAAVSERYIVAKKASKRGMRPNTERALVRYFTKAWAPLRDTPISDIKRADVAARLQEIVKENGAVTASRCRTNLSAMFTWAMKEALCESNPVVATNDPAEGAKRRERVLSDAELAPLWRACRDDDFGRIVKLLILTGCRREEIGALQWQEINTAAGTTTIPGERTKNHHAHMLPLPPMAMELLPLPRAERKFVFGVRGPGFTGWAYSKITLDNRIAEAAGKPLAPWVLHDLRRSMRTGLGRIGVAPHIAELVINHVRGGVQAIYDRHRYEPEIKEALARWADHVMTIVG